MFFILSLSFLGVKLSTKFTRRIFAFTQFQGGLKSCGSVYISSTTLADWKQYRLKLWSSKPITVVGREGGLRPVVSVLKTVCKGVTSSRINASRHS